MDESARRSLNNSRDYFLAFLNQDIFEIGVDLDGPILPPLVATSLLVLSALGLLAKSLAFVAAFAATDFALVAATFALAGAFLAADFALPAPPRVVGNGFDLRQYTFRPTADGSLGWAGRIAPEKGGDSTRTGRRNSGHELH